MYLKCIVFISAAVALMQLTLASFLLEGSDKPIAIKNRRDNTYLTTVDNGKECAKRGDVVTTRKHPGVKKAQEWKVYVNRDGNEDNVHILNAFNNVVSFQNKSFCHLRVDLYEVINVITPRTHSVMLKSLEKQKCLTGMGNGKRISWETCRSVSSNYKKQYWYAEVETENQQ